ncbi:YlzJ-like family protein [Thermoanaerobacterium sp. RBIITD]|uniref:YlzJ-like family protein n=1 Tax=Thermoanaerobacterium sp. RBIITD TaxID=1550240 RepID=UPI000BB7EB69|nr:YlzJ-like family protein [Thermoanaerobacterium sp. RBIITD]SNX55461.1 YlzJ-like protein [Thermoanaerobacterium sp. RBIITD]
MLYTIIPYELIFEKRDDIKNGYLETTIENRHLLLEKITDNSYKIIRMYSTNPNDYLDNKYTPGNTINLKLI